MLDWTADALDRVDREAFFERFDEGEAVQYFYEPFLKEFDPDLRKQLGVWYTPSEVVRYMVARVDMALKDDLGYPRTGWLPRTCTCSIQCCGTGAYVSEVLKRIANNLKGHRTGRAGRVAGEDRRPPSACSGSRSCPRRSWWRTCRSVSPCRTSTLRWQTNESERAGIFLTNALTGWESLLLGSSSLSRAWRRSETAPSG